MTERKKPRTKQELQADIDNHPDRGMIDGKPVIDNTLREIRGKVTAETKRKFLRIISCYGVGMNEGLQMAVAALWRQEKDIVKTHEEEKAREFGVSEKEIQIKEFGHYKQRGRKKRLNLEETNEQ
jgi:hypothetical protein